MFHLIIEQMGVKRCIACRENDDFENGLFIDCSTDYGCKPENFIRSIEINCAGDPPLKLRARIFQD